MTAWEAASALLEVESLQGKGVDPDKEHLDPITTTAAGPAMPTHLPELFSKQIQYWRHLQRWKLKRFRAKALMHMNSALNPISTAAAGPMKLHL